MSDDYILGTHDDELLRLGLQHRVWRSVVLECWRKAGITAGKRVIDVGAGPGYAAMDLAEIVGPAGEVLALERSAKYAAAIETETRKRGLRHVRVQQIDLMESEIPEREFDFSWCRWVMCFVPEPESLVRKIAHALRKGGVTIFHEYVEYRTWGFLPPRPCHAKFVELVMKSWRASGGEADIGKELPALLTRNGFSVLSIRPHIFAITPGDEMWQWPRTFIQSGAERMKELGQMDEAFATELRAEFVAAEKEPGVAMLTPLVVEVVASLEGTG